MVFFNKKSNKSKKGSTPVPPANITNIPSESDFNYNPIPWGPSKLKEVAIPLCIWSERESSLLYLLTIRGRVSQYSDISDSFICKSPTKLSSMY